MKNNSKRTKNKQNKQQNAEKCNSNKPKKEFLKLSSAMVEFKMRRNYRNFSK